MLVWKLSEIYFRCTGILAVPYTTIKFEGGPTLFEILYLIEKSYDISLNHWKYRLNVKHWLGTVSGKNISIENDFEKMFEWADKYFSDDHTYEVNV